MTDAQYEALRQLSTRYNVEFHPSDFQPMFDLPAGYVGGWIGTDKLFVGCSPEGDISS
jgi:hypothetical protein